MFKSIMLKLKSFFTDTTSDSHHQYLCQATDVHDLERRMNRLSRNNKSFY